MFKVSGFWVSGTGFLIFQVLGVLVFFKCSRESVIKGGPQKWSKFRVE